MAGCTKCIYSNTGLKGELHILHTFMCVFREYYGIDEQSCMKHFVAPEGAAVESALVGVEDYNFENEKHLEVWRLSARGYISSYLHNTRISN